MLEILLLIFLCKHMGEKLRAKGWKKPIWMQVAVVALWFGAELFGSVAYCVFLAVRDGPEAAQHPGFLVYPLALLSAAASVGVLFLIATVLPERDPEKGATAGPDAGDTPGQKGGNPFVTG